MRVPVLITITFASGTTALLESVIRPVSDAFVDCARSGVTEVKRIPARARKVRRAITDQDDLAMLKGKTKFKIIVSNFVETSFLETEIPARVLSTLNAFPDLRCVSEIAIRMPQGSTTLSPAFRKKSTSASRLFRSLAVRSASSSKPAFRALKCLQCGVSKIAPAPRSRANVMHLGLAMRDEHASLAIACD